MFKDFANLIEKIRKTLSYIAPAVIGIVIVWFDIDVSLIVSASVALINSILDYIELVINLKKGE